MKNLVYDQYIKLCSDSKVLIRDGYGDKVLKLSDGSILKLFRLKRFISSALFYSPARRFANNARKLQLLSIPTVSIIDLYNIKEIARTSVHYHPLMGKTVREYLEEGNISDEFLSQLGAFFAHLHDKGVFFRSAHFGNIIYTDKGELGLIDISDMSISNKSLSRYKRLRNLKHIFRLSEDILFIIDSDIIEQSYLSSCGIKKKKFHNDFLSISQHLKRSHLKL